MLATISPSSVPDLTNLNGTGSRHLKPPQSSVAASYPHNLTVTGAGTEIVPTPVQNTIEPKLDQFGRGGGGGGQMKDDKSEMKEDETKEPMIGSPEAPLRSSTPSLSSYHHQRTNSTRHRHHQNSNSHSHSHSRSHAHPLHHRHHRRRHPHRLESISRSRSPPSPTRSRSRSPFSSASSELSSFSSSSGSVSSSSRSPSPHSQARSRSRSHSHSSVSSPSPFHSSPSSTSPSSSPSAFDPSHSSSRSTSPSRSRSCSRSRSPTGPKRKRERRHHRSRNHRRSREGDEEEEVKQSMMIMDAATSNRKEEPHALIRNGNMKPTMLIADGNGNGNEIGNGGKENGAVSVPSSFPPAISSGSFSTLHQSASVLSKSMSLQQSTPPSFPLSSTLPAPVPSSSSVPTCTPTLTAVPTPPNPVVPSSSSLVVVRRNNCHACSRCARMKAGCDGMRPCSRCVASNKGWECTDRERQRRSWSKGNTVNVGRKIGVGSGTMVGIGGNGNANGVLTPSATASPASSPGILIPQPTRYASGDLPVSSLLPSRFATPPPPASASAPSTPLSLSSHATSSRFHFPQVHPSAAASLSNVTMIPTAFSLNTNLKGLPTTIMMSTSGSGSRTINTGNTLNGANGSNVAIVPASVLLPSGTMVSTSPGVPDIPISTSSIAAASTPAAVPSSIPATFFSSTVDPQLLPSASTVSNVDTKPMTPLSLPLSSTTSLSSSSCSMPPLSLGESAASFLKKTKHKKRREERSRRRTIHKRELYEEGLVGNEEEKRKNKKMKKKKEEGDQDGAQEESTSTETETDSSEDEERGHENDASEMTVSETSDGEGARDRRREAKGTPEISEEQKMKRREAMKNRTVLVPPHLATGSPLHFSQLASSPTTSTSVASLLALATPSSSAGSSFSSVGPTSTSTSSPSGDRIGEGEEEARGKGKGDTRRESGEGLSDISTSAFSPALRPLSESESASAPPSSNSASRSSTPDSTAVPYPSSSSSAPPASCSFSSPPPIPGPPFSTYTLKSLSIHYCEHSCGCLVDVPTLEESERMDKIRKRKGVKELMNYHQRSARYHPNCAGRNDRCTEMMRRNSNSSAAGGGSRSRPTSPSRANSIPASSVNPLRIPPSAPPPTAPSTVPYTEDSLFNLSHPTLSYTQHPVPLSSTCSSLPAGGLNRSLKRPSSVHGIGNDEGERVWERRSADDQRLLIKGRMGLGHGPARTSFQPSHTMHLNGTTVSTSLNPSVGGGLQNGFKRRRSNSLSDTYLIPDGPLPLPSLLPSFRSNLSSPINSNRSIVSSNNSSSLSSSSLNSNFSSGIHITPLIVPSNNTMPIIPLAIHSKLASSSTTAVNPINTTIDRTDANPTSMSLSTNAASSGDSSMVSTSGAEIEPGGRVGTDQSATPHSTSSSSISPPSLITGNGAITSVPSGSVRDPALTAAGVTMTPNVDASSAPLSTLTSSSLFSSLLSPSSSSSNTVPSVPAPVPSFPVSASVSGSVSGLSDFASFVSSHRRWIECEHHRLVSSLQQLNEQYLVHLKYLEEWMEIKSKRINEENEKKIEEMREKISKFEEQMQNGVKNNREIEEKENSTQR